MTVALSGIDCCQGGAGTKWLVPPPVYAQVISAQLLSVPTPVSGVQVPV
jgi:hypothetical protein